MGCGFGELSDRCRATSQEDNGYGILTTLPYATQCTARMLALNCEPFLQHGAIFVMNSLSRCNREYTHNGQMNGSLESHFYTALEKVY